MLAPVIAAAPASRRAVAQGPSASAVAAAGLLLLQAVLVLRHQPWADEWQALAIATRSPTVADLLAELHYEGHPPLWYLLLRLAAHLLPPRWTLAGVQLAVALAIQSLLLFRAPFRPHQRLMLGLGAFALFEWGTIARDLGLGVLLGLAAVAARDRRCAWAAIALLPLVGVQAGMLSVMLLGLQALDRRWWWPGALVWTLAAIAAAVSVVPAPGISPAAALRPLALQAAQTVQALGVLLVPVQLGEAGGWGWNGMLPFPAGFACGLAFVWASLRAPATSAHRALYAALLAATLGFACFVYPLAPRHLSQLLLALILLRWRAAEAGLPVGRPIDIWLALQAACGLVVAAIELTSPFDSAAVAVAQIRTLGLAQASWLATPIAGNQGIAALLNRDLATPPTGCGRRFARWDATPDRLDAATLAALTRRGRLHIVSREPIALPGVRELAAIPPGWDGIPYHLSVAGTGPEAPPPPPCPPAPRWRAPWPH